MLLSCIFRSNQIFGKGLPRLSQSSRRFERLYIRCISRSREVTIIHDEDNNRVAMSLPYINEDFRINKTFNFDRGSDEKCAYILSRMNYKVNNYIENALKKKKISLEKVEVNVRLIRKNEASDNSDADPTKLSILEMLENVDDYFMKIGDCDYELNVNPPVLTKFEIGKKSILAGYFLYPTLEGINCNLDETILKWFRTIDKFEEYEKANCKMIKESSWEEVGEGFSILTSDDDISRVFKVVGTPRNGSDGGEDSVAISKVLVSKGPESCPFERRHRFTSQTLSHDFLRVVSYNILANFYVNSEYSRTVLFPTCPPYALEMPYRKQLLLKEILGYNADIICLQEVDTDIYSMDFKPMLYKLGFEGVYNNKGYIKEGLATFYRKSKLQLKETKCYQLGSELVTNPLFIDLLAKIKVNEDFLAIFSTKKTILQVTVFNRVENPSQILIVGTTHLHSGPFSNHIRLLQTGVCIELLKQSINLQKLENPCADVSTVFCGDLNSIPESGVYRLLSSHTIDEDHLDWSSKDSEKISNVAFSHDLKMASACGTPQYTNYTVDFKACLDYIFYQTNKFDVEQIVPFLTNEELTEKIALPSVKVPSDHIALIADLKWK